MDIREQLMELETTAQHISDGLAAIQVMVVGLDGLGSQYAGALNAVCSYLYDAEQALQKQLALCLRTV